MIPTIGEIAIVVLKYFLSVAVVAFYPIARVYYAVRVQHILEDEYHAGEDVQHSYN